MALEKLGSGSKKEYPHKKAGVSTGKMKNMNVNASKERFTR